MTEDELRDVYNAITASWKLVKKYSEVKPNKEDPDFWRNCIQDASKFIKDGTAGEFFGIAALNTLDLYFKIHHVEQT